MRCSSRFLTRRAVGRRGVFAVACTVVPMVWSIDLQWLRVWDGRCRAIFCHALSLFASWRLVLAFIEVTECRF